MQGPGSACPFLKRDSASLAQRGGGGSVGVVGIARGVGGAHAVGVGLVLRQVRDRGVGPADVDVPDDGEVGAAQPLALLDLEPLLVIRVIRPR